MKLVLNLFLFSFSLFIFSDKSFSLTNYQIKRICKDKLRNYICVKNLKEKRSNLQKGKLIEIPVKPYRDN